MADTAEQKLDARSVLIISDDHRATRLLKEVAESENCTVTVISKPEEIRRGIDRLRPAIIFLKLEMGDQDMLGTCRFAGSQNSAVIITARNPSRADVLAAAKMGACGFVVQPMEKQTVAEKLIETLAFAKENLKRQQDFRALASQQKALPVRERVNYVLEHIEELMTLPYVPAKVMSLCQKSGVDIKDIQKTIQMDTVLSAIVLKRSNSAAYGGSTRISRLSEAITRIGFRMVRSIATLTAVFEMFEPESGTISFDRFGSWIHSLSVGIIAEYIARQAKTGFVEDAFMAGIIHDLGKLVFDDHLHEEYQKILETTVREDIPERKAEDQALNITHELMGSTVAKRWKISTDVCHAVAHHHADAEMAGREHATLSLSALIYAANLITKALLIGDAGDWRTPPMPYTLWKTMKIKRENLRTFIQEISDTVTEFSAWLKIPEKSRPALQLQPPRDEWIYIVDGYKPDGLLDIFFVQQGYDTFHSVDTIEQEKAPAMVLYDFREGLPDKKLDVTARTEADTRHLLLKGEDDIPDGLVPDSAQTIPVPLNYLNLFRLVSGNKPPSSATA